MDALFDRSSLSTTACTITARLPQAIAWWRYSLQLTRGELAQRSGLSVCELKCLERGRKNGPRTDTLERLCAGLGITLLELILRAERVKDE